MTFSFTRRHKWPSSGLERALKISFQPGLQNPVVLDVGAHYGESLPVIDKTKRGLLKYYGFEPDPDSFLVLRREALRFGILPTHVFQVAVGDSNSTVTFHKTQASAVSGVLKPEPELSVRVPSGDHRILAEIGVQQVKLDSFAADRKISRIDVLKVDTEGYDLRVLEGATALLEGGRIRVIMTEVFFVKYRQDQSFFWDIAALMHQFDYKFVDLFDIRRTQQGRLYTANAIWVCEDVAIDQGYF